MFDIEKNVPISHAPKGKYPLGKMEVNDSFLAPISHRNYISMAMSQMKKRTGRAYMMRKVDDDHVRIWRVE